MDFKIIVLTYVIWLLAVRFFVARGLGPVSSFAKDFTTFLLGKGLGPANDLIEDRPGAGARAWYAHGILWFILAATLSFTKLWTAHEPDALYSLGAVGYSPSAAQATAAVHVAAAFGGISMLLIASGFASQAKLCGGRLASESNAALMAWAWSGLVFVGVVISNMDMIGGSNWFELPPVYYLLFTVIALPLFFNHLLTMSASDSPILVPQWFFVMGFAALIWLGPATMLVNQSSLAGLLGGDAELVSWMLVKVLFGGWLLSQALGVAHHVVPSAVGAPLWSRSLSTMALFGTFLTFSPLGAQIAVEGVSDTMRAIVAIMLTISLLPIIATVANLSATASGRMSKLYGAKMTMLGVALLVPIGVGSLFASVSAFGGGAEQSHIGATLDNLAIWGVCGAIALGGAHHLFPSTTGRSLASDNKSRWAFFLVLFGVLGYGIGQLIADHVNAALGSEVVVAALEAAEVAAPDTAASVQVFGSIMFYGVAIAGVLTAQNMLTGSFRGTKLTDDTPTAGVAPSRHIVSGATTVRHLLEAGVGLDTEISMEAGSGSSGHISLADLSAPEVDQVGDAEADDGGDSGDVDSGDGDSGDGDSGDVDSGDGDSGDGDSGDGDSGDKGEPSSVDAEDAEDVTISSGGFSKMLKAELVSVANSAGLDSSGTKAEIIARLNAA
jgi:cbb3-type cytochrome oxidase subunit 1